MKLHFSIQSRQWIFENKLKWNGRQEEDPSNIKKKLTELVLKKKFWNVELSQKKSNYW